MVKEHLKSFKLEKGFYDEYVSYYTKRIVVCIFYKGLLKLDFDGVEVSKSMWVAGG